MMCFKAHALSSDIKKSVTVHFSGILMGVKQHQTDVYKRQATVLFLFVVITTNTPINLHCAHIN